MHALHRIGMVALALAMPAHAAPPRPSQPDPDLSAQRLDLFDRPTGTAKTVLPPRPNDPNPLGVVRCFYYPEFTIKELDYGEHGDTAISVTPASGPGLPRCGKQDDPGERIMPDGQSSYFLGVKAGFVFLTSTFGGNGLSPFSIYDGLTGKRLFKGIATVNGPFALASENGRLMVRFESGVSGLCSLLSGGTGCWAHFSRPDALPAPIASRPAPIPSCEAAYRAGGSGVGRDDPSVVYYETSLTLDKAGRVTQPAYGSLRCSYSD